MPTFSSIICPHCGFPNIPEEQYCRHCRGNIWIDPNTLPSAPATEETVTLYRDDTGERLLTISRSCLEYAAPDIAFRSTWSNLTMIRHGFFDYYVYMRQEPTIIRATWRHMPRPSLDRPWEPTFPERCIGLKGFGFPTNRQLCNDFSRYAPQLVRYMPK